MGFLGVLENATFVLIIDVQLPLILQKWNDVNNITSLLKLFLRKLPEGLVTAGNKLFTPKFETGKKIQISLIL